MRRILVSLVLSTALGFCYTACSAKKIVARNCDKAGNAEVFVCDPL